MRAYRAGNAKGGRHRCQPPCRRTAAAPLADRNQVSAASATRAGKGKRVLRRSPGPGALPPLPGRDGVLSGPRRPAPSPRHNGGAVKPCWTRHSKEGLPHLRPRLRAGGIAMHLVFSGIVRRPIRCRSSPSAFERSRRNVRVAFTACAGHAGLRFHPLRRLSIFAPICIRPPIATFAAFVSPLRSRCGFQKAPAPGS